MLAPYITTETRLGDPILVGDTTIVPMAKSSRIQIPGWRGGVIWNRPISVLVQTSDGGEEVLPIRDVTRRTQLGLITGSIIGLLSVWLLRRLSKKK